MRDMIKETLRKLSLAARRALLTALLFIVYILGFGITKIFAFIFNKSLYAAKTKETNSFWSTPQGYEADYNESKMES